MDKPQVIRINPMNIDEDLKGPVLSALVQKGWTIQTSVILSDPRKPEEDRLRLGLIMFPPVEVPASAPERWTWQAALVVGSIASLPPLALVFALMG